MIRVVIEMEPDGSALQIRADLPPIVVLAVINSAYIEMLSQKIRADLHAESRIIRPMDGNSR